MGDPFAEGSRRLSLTRLQNGRQHHLPSLIWFTVGYRRRDLSAKGRPPTKGCLLTKGCSSDDCLPLTKIPLKYCRQHYFSIDTIVCKQLRIRLVKPA
ncbi:MAG: hypothetical protein LBK82_15580 [Planctomycetaceae bacterium]|nr:hypothetical protein [Planctomycetaceae bacterium]